MIGRGQNRRSKSLLMNIGEIDTRVDALTFGLFDDAEQGVLQCFAETGLAAAVRAIEQDLSLIHI